MVKSDSNPIFHVIMSRACLAQFGNIELVPFPNISISYPMKINYLYTCNVTFPLAYAILILDFLCGNKMAFTT